jgi:hypothetical protein
VGDPLFPDVLATSAGKPNVMGGLGIGEPGHDVLGLVEMGGLYPELASGAPATFSASVSFSFDPDQISGNAFLIGLQDGQFTGNGFDLLGFDIIAGGSTILDENFTSLFDALNFFDDQFINIGSIKPDPFGFLDLTFDLAVTAHSPGDGFAIDLAVANANVPEPSTLAVFGTGMVLLGFGWRLRPSRKECPADSPPMDASTQRAAASPMFDVAARRAA